jgi:nitroreductase
MDVLQFIKSRRSIRKFLDKPVEKKDITVILEAARWAPSAGNCQPWRFIVVTDEKKKGKFDPFFHQPWVEKAPVIIVILAYPEATWKRYGLDSIWYIQDCAAAAENMLLMAHGLGLGAVWVGAFSKEAVAKRLEIDSQYEVFGLVCIGHYKENDRVTLDGGIFANDDRRQRRSLDKIAFDETFDTPWNDKLPG